MINAPSWFLVLKITLQLAHEEEEDGDHSMDM